MEKNSFHWVVIIAISCWYVPSTDITSGYTLSKLHISVKTFRLHLLRGRQQGRENNAAGDPPEAESHYLGCHAVLRLSPLRRGSDLRLPDFGSTAYWLVARILRHGLFVLPSFLAKAFNPPEAWSESGCYLWEWSKKKMREQSSCLTVKAVLSLWAGKLNLSNLFDLILFLVFFVCIPSQVVRLFPYRCSFGSRSPTSAKYISTKF